MNIKERFGNVWYNFKKIDENALLSYQNAIFFIVVADLIGIYYFLQWKVLGTAILILCLVFLGLIMYRLQDFPPRKENKKYKPQKPPKDNEFSVLVDPTSYNKRLEKAMGTI